MKTDLMNQNGLQEMNSEQMRLTSGGNPFLIALAVLGGAKAIAYGVGYLVGTIEQMLEEE